jgi:hypothetical protein
MSSIDGELIIILLTSGGQVVAQQPVRLMVADAIFTNLPAGRYTVIARHPSLDPTEVRQDIMLADNRMFGVKYFYAEADKRLLKIEILERRLDV